MRTRYPLAEGVEVLPVKALQEVMAKQVAKLDKTATVKARDALLDGAVVSARIVFTGLRFHADNDRDANFKIFSLIPYSTKRRALLEEMRELWQCAGTFVDLAHRCQSAPSNGLASPSTSQQRGRSLVAKPGRRAARVLTRVSKECLQRHECRQKVAVPFVAPSS